MRRFGGVRVYRIKPAAGRSAAVRGVSAPVVKRKRSPGGKSNDVFSSMLVEQLRLAGVTVPAVEFRFDPLRRWKFDLAWPGIKLAIEVEGAIWKLGRHNRPAGFIKDMEKYNTATLNNWRVLRVTTDQVRAGDALRLVLVALARFDWSHVRSRVPAPESGR